MPSTNVHGRLEYAGRWSVLMPIAWRGLLYSKHIYGLRGLWPEKPKQQPPHMFQSAQASCCCKDVGILSSKGHTDARVSDLHYGSFLATIFLTMDRIWRSPEALLAHLAGDYGFEVDPNTSEAGRLLSSNIRVSNDRWKKGHGVSADSLGSFSSFSTPMSTP